MVWVISLLYFTSLAGTLVSFALIYSGAMPMIPELKLRLESLSWIDYGVTILVTLGNFAGAALLLLLRRQAYTLFVSVFALSIASVVYEIVVKNGWSDLKVLGLVGLAVGWSVKIAIILYTRSLTKAGVLK